MNKQDLMKKTVIELKLIAKHMQLHRYSALRKENYTVNGIPRFPVGITTRDYE
jgi:hypothetical protein